MTKRLRTCTVVGGLLCLALSWSGQGAEQDAEHDERVKELLRHLPPIQASDPDVETVTLQGWSAAELGSSLFFDVAYGGPDQHVVVVRDPHDQVPLWVATNQATLVYDPRSGELIQMYGARSTVIFDGSGGSFRARIEFAAGTARDEGNPWMHFEIDVRSLLYSMALRAWQKGDASIHSQVKLTEADKGPATLEVEVRGMRSAAIIDPSSRFRLLSAGVSLNSEQARGLGLRRGEDAIGEPGDWSAWDAVITNVAVNRPLPAQALVTPIPEEIQGLVVREATEAESGRLEFLWTVRAALRRPELREAVERQVGPVDWQEAERLDKIASEPWKAYIDALYRPEGEQGASTSPGR